VCVLVNRDIMSVLWAAYGGCAQTLHTLAKLGAHFDATDRNNRHALHIAATNDRLEAISAIYTITDGNLYARDNQQVPPLTTRVYIYTHTHLHRHTIKYVYICIYWFVILSTFTVEKVCGGLLHTHCIYRHETHAPHTHNDTHTHTHATH